MEKILSICKPSYNRFDVIIPDIKEYLSIGDDRLVIKINDNCSTNPEIEDLKKIASDNANVILNINDYNEGPIPNFMKSLSNAPSKYIMLLLDKDTVDIKLLPEFIDYLENEKPNFGFVDLGNDKPRHEEIFKAGYDAISHVAYLRKHPSGYFWKTDLFYEEMNKQYFKEMDPSFDFPFGAICGSLASKYDATIIVWPLVINANMRSFSNPVYKKTYSYNDENFYFGKRWSLIGYNYFIKNALSLEITNKEKEMIVDNLTYNAMAWCTTDLRRLYQRKNVCEYYNLRMRNISFPEMIKNIVEVVKIYFLTTKGYVPIHKTLGIIAYSFGKSFLRICKMCVRDMLIKPKEEPFKA